MGKRKVKKPVVDSKVGIYRLHGIKGESKVKVEHTENLDHEQCKNLRDTSIIKYDIDKKNFIFGEVFRCNITNYSLVKSDKQPIMYLSAYLEKPIKAASLYNLVVYFNIDTENIKSERDLMTKDLTGNFSIEVHRDGEISTLDKQIDTFPGDDEIQQMLIDFTKESSMKALLKELADIEEQKIANKYKSNFNIDEIPKATISLKDYEVEDYY